MLFYLRMARKTYLLGSLGCTCLMEEQELVLLIHQCYCTLRQSRPDLPEEGKALFNNTKKYNIHHTKDDSILEGRDQQEIRQKMHIKSSSNSTKHNRLKTNSNTWKIQSFKCYYITPTEVVRRLIVRPMAQSKV